MRTPGLKQHRTLLSLASGSAGLSFTKGVAEPLLNHGWVTAEWKAPYYQWVRITPEGLRALALAIERYGLPEINPKKATTTRRVCGECGSTRYRFESIPAEEAIA